MGEAILSGGLIAYVTARLTIDRQAAALWIAHRLLVWRAGDQARIAAKEAANKMIVRLDDPF